MFGVIFQVRAQEQRLISRLSSGVSRNNADDDDDNDDGGQHLCDGRKEADDLPPAADAA